MHFETSSQNTPVQCVGVPEHIHKHNLDQSQMLHFVPTNVSGLQLDADAFPQSAPGEPLQVSFFAQLQTPGESCQQTNE